MLTYDHSQGDVFHISKCQCAMHNLKLLQWTSLRRFSRLSLCGKSWVGQKYPLVYLCESADDFHTTLLKTIQNGIRKKVDVVPSFQILDEMSFQVKGA